MAFNHSKLKFTSAPSEDLKVLGNCNILLLLKSSYSELHTWFGIHNFLSQWYNICFTTSVTDALFSPIIRPRVFDIQKLLKLANANVTSMTSFHLGHTKLHPQSAMAAVTRLEASGFPQHYNGRALGAGVLHFFYIRTPLSTIRTGFSFTPPSDPIAFFFPLRFHQIAYEQAGFSKTIYSHFSVRAWAMMDKLFSFFN